MMDAACGARIMAEELDGQDDGQLACTRTHDAGADGGGGSVVNGKDSNEKDAAVSTRLCQTQRLNRLLHLPKAETVTDSKEIKQEAIPKQRRAPI